MKSQIALQIAFTLVQMHDLNINHVEGQIDHVTLSLHEQTRDLEFRLQSYSDMRRHEDNFMTAETDLVSDFRR